MIQTNITGMINSRRMGCEGHVAFREEENACSTSVGKSECQ